MVTPNQRRRVAGMLMERFGVSERRACRLIGQARSTQRLARPVLDDEEGRLRAWLCDFSKRRPRWGWRRAAVGLRAEGWTVNNKRIRRLWRDEGLRVVHRKRKKPLRGYGHVGAFCPIRPNVVWALDFQFDQTADAGTLKLLNVIDEHIRECPAIVVDRNIDADKVVATLDRIAAERGAPAYVRFDNGPEFYRRRRRRLVPIQRHDDRVHRTGLTVAERMDRELQRPTTRRAAQWRAIRQPPRDTRRDRELAHRLQHEPAALLPREPHPDRVRQPLAPTPPTPTPTLIASGPTTGARSTRRRVGTDLEDVESGRHRAL
jgi:HTH-like domain/Integrase core domain